MSATEPQKTSIHSQNNINLPIRPDQTSTVAAEASAKPPTPAPAVPAPPAVKIPTYLGNVAKVPKISKQLAVTRCLNSVTGGNKSPWKAYPGHNRLATVDMDLNGKRESGQFYSSSCENSDVQSWLEWRVQPESDDLGRRSSKERIKLLLVTLAGGETSLSNADKDANVLRSVFDAWGFPTSALSCLLDRRATFTDQQTVVKPPTKDAKRTRADTRRVLCIGMRQWCMVWSPSPHDPPFGARGVVICLDKTWASSVPSAIQQYLKTMWTFTGFQGILPLVACMTSLRYTASALTEDDKEAFRREFELRSWLKGGLSAERKDLGYTSAQVSWLSSRVSRHRDRLMVTNRMLGILKEDLDVYEIFAATDNFEILRDCICNLADMKEHLRSQARQLEAQANVQLAALFNLITQKDSATALIIAKTSQSIAADSRRDQKVSVDIANSSRLIAYNTLRDSASMKAIANVTMVFLPGTFMASVFAMPFFSTQKPTGFFVDAKIWIYVLFTIPLTLVTLFCAWAWFHFSDRSHRTLNGKDAEENRTPLTGGFMNGGKLGVDTSPDPLPTPSPAEKTSRQVEHDKEEDQLSGTSPLNLEFEDEEISVNDFEHWDPMTREFAPSIFEASSFAFTEDSDAMSIWSNVASIGSAAPKAADLVDIVASSLPEPTFSKTQATYATKPPSWKTEMAAAQARVMERKRQTSRELAMERERESKKKPPRRAWVSDDDSEPEIVVQSPTLSKHKPAGLFPLPQQAPTRESPLKHVERPGITRSRDRTPPRKSMSFADAGAERRQSSSPTGFRAARPSRAASTAWGMFQTIDPEDPYSYGADKGTYAWARARPDPATARAKPTGGFWGSATMPTSRTQPASKVRSPDTSSKGAPKDPQRGRDYYKESSRARNASGDSVRSRGSGHSHRDYSY